jgi:hypothetical protein
MEAPQRRTGRTMAFPCLLIAFGTMPPERATVTIYFNNSIYIIDVIVIIEVIDNICFVYRYRATSCTRW